MSGNCYSTEYSETPKKDGDSWSVVQPSNNTELWERRAKVCAKAWGLKYVD